MAEITKHLTDAELEEIARGLEEELATAEQQPGASWYRATLWHCIRKVRKFSTTPHATESLSIINTCKP